MSEQISTRPLTLGQKAIVDSIPVLPNSSFGASSGSLPVTHKALVRSMATWLRSAKGCTIVMAELSTYNTETPDCIGFHSSGGGSVLVECKVSRADFLADRSKIFRRYSEQGMGDLRYFAVPIGVLKPDDLPAGWGLIEVRDSLRTRRITVEAQRMEANKRAEVTMLVSAIRRLEISSAVFVQPQEENRDYAA